MLFSFNNRKQIRVGNIFIKVLCFIINNLSYLSFIQSTKLPLCFSFQLPK